MSLPISDLPDTWARNEDPLSLFSVKSFRRVIEAKLLPTSDIVFNLKNCTLSKSIALLRELPRPYNLPTSHSKHRCWGFHILYPLCKSSPEDLVHLFALCRFANDVFARIIDWHGLGISGFLCKPYKYDALTHSRKQCWNANFLTP